MIRDNFSVKVADKCAVTGEVYHKAEAVRCTGEGLKLLIGSIGLEQLVAHRTRNKVIGLTVYDQHRIFRMLYSFYCACRAQI